ncbi:SDR family oxidoreductase [Auritidibacter ignavus]|uniref:NAD(P)-dependent oxidoreductase n=1 Tax=Auritidibacter ignavus TaxID=678932 RepID=A0AAJ6DF03_9MICC|nr:NAD(P)-dependent oxidoreductase [Auritidibacter ignavus]WGH83886.1 NAD(P)-dependent oxidoreductase [Auritidibacter ignavus]WGH90835.1 NAD(P)-dependent oxidoreductase [Auritidibacter ignavus]WGH93208.1 NAD(P)-dependent oxidoreductase [Auritidibacter ignavus]
MTHESSNMLSGKTVILSGGSRGIGLEIAKKLASDGAQIALLAKTAEPHPKLPGTVYTAADEIREAGGKALPLVGDVREESNVVEAVNKTVAEFGGIDIVINNASAINLEPSDKIEMKRVDLMHDINTRGTFLLTRTALPYLKKSSDPRILTLSPPLNTSPKWLGVAPAYMLAKYGMTLAALGIGAEHRIPSTTLWPETTIQTAAVQYALGGDEMMKVSRTADVYSDSAHVILTSAPQKYAGATVLCEEVLRDHGVTDFSKYSPGVDEKDLQKDLFVD